jgi:anti-sigma regulatory factor (Ser/Thr protein kinase)
MISWMVSCSELTLPDTQRLRIRGALHELLLNAVEHGTLELGFQAKRKALAEGRYEELLLQRLTQPHLKDRQVAIQIRHEKDAKSLTYRIADEGNGFNWHRFLENSYGGDGSDEINGRGIFLARSLFPSLTYNDRGNEVTITVPLS